MSATFEHQIGELLGAVIVHAARRDLAQVRGDLETARAEHQVVQTAYLGAGYGLLAAIFNGGRQRVEASAAPAGPPPPRRPRPFAGWS